LDNYKKFKFYSTYKNENWYFFEIKNIIYYKL
jgi:hypothetical protein